MLTEAKKKKRRRGGNPFIDTEPQIPDGSGIREDFSDTKLDVLIRYGLGEPDKFVWTKKALSDPASAYPQPALREIVSRSLKQLVEMILHDQQLYTRVRTLLQHGHLHEAALRSRGRPSASGAPPEDDPNLHMVMQLKKAISLRGRDVSFKDGSSYHVSPQEAHSLLDKHDELRGEQRSEFVAKLGHSRNSFHQVLVGK